MPAPFRHSRTRGSSLIAAKEANERTAKTLESIQSVLETGKVRINDSQQKFGWAEQYKSLALAVRQLDKQILAFERLLCQQAPPDQLREGRTIELSSFNEDSERRCGASSDKSLSEKSQIPLALCCLPSVGNIHHSETQENDIDESSDGTKRLTKMKKAHNGFEESDKSEGSQQKSRNTGNKCDSVSCDHTTGRQNDLVQFEKFLLAHIATFRQVIKPAVAMLSTHSGSAGGEKACLAESRKESEERMTVEAAPTEPSVRNGGIEDDGSSSGSAPIPNSSSTGTLEVLKGLEREETLQLCISVISDSRNTMELLSAAIVSEIEQTSEDVARSKKNIRQLVGSAWYDIVANASKLDDCTSAAQRKRSSAEGGLVGSKMGDLSEEEEELMEMTNLQSSSEEDGHSSAEIRKALVRYIGSVSHVEEEFVEKTSLIKTEELRCRERRKAVFQDMMCEADEGVSFDSLLRQFLGMYSCVTSSHGMSRKINMRRLETIFSGISKENLRIAMVATDELEHLRQRYLGECRHCNSRRVELLTKIRTEISDIQLESKREEQMQRDSIKSEQKAQEILLRLEQQRREFAVRKQTNDLEEGLKRSEEQMAKQKSKKARGERNIENKRLVVEYTQKKENELLDKKKKLEEERAQEAIEKEIIARVNKLRIKRRREYDDVQKEEILRDKLKVELERQELEQRLKRAAEKFAVIAPRDVDRLHEQTESSKSRDKSRIEELKWEGRVKHFGVTEGFSVDELLKDSRFRLSASLCNVGLFTTQAGREAMRNIQSIAMKQAPQLATSEANILFRCQE